VQRTANAGSRFPAAMVVLVPSDSANNDCERDLEQSSSIAQAHRLEH
jgi:hypothetical protein